VPEAATLYGCHSYNFVLIQQKNNELRRTRGAVGKGGKNILQLAYILTQSASQVDRASNFHLPSRIFEVQGLKVRGNTFFSCSLF